MRLCEAKRLIFIIPFYHDGGVEVWMRNIAYAFPNIEKIAIIHGPITNPLDKNIPLLNVVSIENSIVQLNKVLKEHRVSNKDIVISALTPSNFKAILLKKIFKFNLITSLHISIKRQRHESFLKPIIRKYLYKIFYYN
ncbi:hypothetical protein HN799_05600, partial [Candidatus Woesearchaeota archaeon]|nr:hypothetical protein [Candidatus Woesearchaeota archaeon]